MKAKLLIQKLTNGFPMEKKGSLFFDPIGGCTVYLFVDHTGKEWMAKHAWDVWRVERPNKDDL